MASRADHVEADVGGVEEQPAVHRVHLIDAGVDIVAEAGQVPRRELHDQGVQLDLRPPFRDFSPFRARDYLSYPKCLYLRGKSGERPRTWTREPPAIQR